MSRYSAFNSGKIGRSGAGILQGNKFQYTAQRKFQEEATARQQLRRQEIERELIARANEWKFHPQINLRNLTHGQARLVGMHMFLMVLAALSGAQDPQSAAILKDANSQGFNPNVRPDKMAEFAAKSDIDDLNQTAEIYGDSFNYTEAVAEKLSGFAYPVSLVNTALEVAKNLRDSTLGSLADTALTGMLFTNPRGRMALAARGVSAAYPTQPATFTVSSDEEINPLESPEDRVRRAPPPNPPPPPPPTTSTSKPTTSTSTSTKTTTSTTSTTTTTKTTSTTPSTTTTPATTTSTTTTTTTPSTSTTNEPTTTQTTTTTTTHPKTTTTTDGTTVTTPATTKTNFSSSSTASTTNGTTTDTTSVSFTTQTPSTTSSAVSTTTEPTSVTTSTTFAKTSSTTTSLGITNSSELSTTTDYTTTGTPVKTTVTLTTTKPLTSTTSATTTVTITLSSTGKITNATETTVIFNHTTTEELSTTTTKPTTKTITETLTASDTLTSSQIATTTAQKDRTPGSGGGGSFLPYVGAAAGAAVAAFLAAIAVSKTARDKVKKCFGCTDAQIDQARNTEAQATSAHNSADHKVTRQHLEWIGAVSPNAPQDDERTNQLINEKRRIASALVNIGIPLTAHNFRTALSVYREEAGISDDKTLPRARRYLNVPLSQKAVYCEQAFNKVFGSRELLVNAICTYNRRYGDLLQQRTLIEENPEEANYIIPEGQRRPAALHLRYRSGNRLPEFSPSGATFEPEMNTQDALRTESIMTINDEDKSLLPLKSELTRSKPVFEFSSQAAEPSPFQETSFNAPEYNEADDIQVVTTGAYERDEVARAAKPTIYASKEEAMGPQYDAATLDVDEEDMGSKLFANRRSTLFEKPLPKRVPTVRTVESDYAVGDDFKPIDDVPLAQFDPRKQEQQNDLREQMADMANNSADFPSITESLQRIKDPETLETRANDKFVNDSLAAFRAKQQQERRPTAFAAAPASDTENLYALNSEQPLYAFNDIYGTRGNAAPGFSSFAEESQATYDDVDNPYALGPNATLYAIGGTAGQSEDPNLYADPNEVRDYELPDPSAAEQYYARRDEAGADVAGYAQVRRTHAPVGLQDIAGYGNANTAQKDVVEEDLYGTLLQPGGYLDVDEAEEDNHLHPSTAFSPTSPTSQDTARLLRPRSPSYDME